MDFKKKLREYFNRYALPSVFAGVSTLLVANIVLFLSESIILSAIISTIVSNLGYYCIIIYKDLKLRTKKDKDLSIKNILKVSRNLLIEFGPGEYFSVFMIKPFLLATIPYFFENYSFAIIVSLLLSGSSFYLLVISSYELRKRFFKD